MKAIHMFGAGDVRVLDVPDAAIAAPTDAVVRVVRACICGSDLHPFHTLPETPGGKPMGHEFIGVVEAVGRDVATLVPGDFVIAPFHVQDNTCVFCAEGLHTSCLNGAYYGGDGLGGGQAEAVRVPLADGSLVKVPGVGEDSPLLASLLTLSDVYLTGWHAAVAGRVAPGSTVTVVGDGAVGLCAVLAARELGAERIVLMGRHEARTELGREFGATDVVAERGAEGVARVRELTGGHGTHVVLEAVGHMPAYEQAAGVVRPGGIISRVGVPQYDLAPVGWAALFGDNVTLTGGVAPVRAYMEQAIGKVTMGAIDPGRVFDVVMPLVDAPAGYAAMDERRALKVMLDPSA